MSNENRNEANRPVHVVRYGVLKAAVWRNVVDNGNATRAMYNVTLTRSYRDGDEQWRDSQSMGYDDLLVAAKALTECHTWVAQQMARDAHESREESQQPQPQQKASPNGQAPRRDRAERR